MRNISFFVTQDQFVNRTKYVTRRDSWKGLKDGAWLMGVEKGQGIKKGCLKRLGPIEVLEVRRERLDEICKVECVLEGFPEMSPREFMHEVYIPTNPGATESSMVTRIHYTYLDWIPSDDYYAKGKSYVKSPHLGFIEKAYTVGDKGLAPNWDWIPNETRRPSWLKKGHCSPSCVSDKLVALALEHCTKEDIELWAAKYIL